VDEAVKNFEADKRAAAQKAELERANTSEITEARKDALRGFVRSLLTYLVVGGGLFVVNQSVAHGAWWLWMMGAWGFAVLLQLISVMTPSSKNYRRAERRAERRARREARQQAKQRIRESTREFERAVEKGVAHLLSATAKHIDEHVDAARKNRR